EAKAARVKFLPLCDCLLAQGDEDVFAHRESDPDRIELDDPCQGTRLRPHEIATGNQWTPYLAANGGMDFGVGEIEFRAADRRTGRFYICGGHVGPGLSFVQGSPGSRLPLDQLLGSRQGALRFLLCGLASRQLGACRGQLRFILIWLDSEEKISFLNPLPGVKSDFLQEALHPGTNVHSLDGFCLSQELVMGVDRLNLDRLNHHRRGWHLGTCGSAPGRGKQGNRKCERSRAPQKSPQFVHYVPRCPASLSDRCGSSRYHFHDSRQRLI